MVDFLVRFVQIHESFRKPELQALADLFDLQIEFVQYQANSPFCIIRLENEQAARKIISRSILSYAIYELWGVGSEYTILHEDVRSRSQHLWNQHKDVSFRFTIDDHQGKRNMTQTRSIIESFSYLGFEGPIIMRGAELEMVVFEYFERKAPSPSQICLGRFLAHSDRDAILKYDLKKRHYISTTSMDSELALVTANMTHASAGKLFYDPFMGTGSFPIACAHFGAVTTGSDIDGRSIKGKGDRNVIGNFDQYGLTSHYIDGFISDLTNTPLRAGRWLDGILCDPPYGVREGLKVLGRKDGEGKEPFLIDGTPAHLLPGFIAPKKPYSFEAMLDNILGFAEIMLVDGARLSIWMPTANDEDIELAIPTNTSLKLVSVCVQPFNKWARRLLTYQRIPDSEVDGSVERPTRTYAEGIHADELNSFRRKYFGGFKESNEYSDNKSEQSA